MIVLDRRNQTGSHLAHVGVLESIRSGAGERLGASALESWYRLCNVSRACLVRTRICRWRSRRGNVAHSFADGRNDEDGQRTCRGAAEHNAQPPRAVHACSQSNQLTCCADSDSIGDHWILVRMSLDVAEALPERVDEDVGYGRHGCLRSYVSLLCRSLALQVTQPSMP